jgi:hypothetical protein
MNKPGQSGAKAPALYQGFNGQYIDGSWRPGKHGGVRVDTDPYSGATLAETVMANQRDLDEAYHAAAKAQVSWAARLPAVFDLRWYPHSTPRSVLLKVYLIHARINRKYRNSLRSLQKSA